MQQDISVRVRWFTFDVPTLVVLITTVVSGTGAYFTLQNRIDKIEQSRTERATVADQRFMRIENAQLDQSHKVEELPMLTQRMTTIETQMQEMGRRLDRFAELVTNNIELVRKDINTLAIKQEVTTTEVKGMNDKLDRALNNREGSNQTQFLPPLRSSLIH